VKQSEHTAYNINHKNAINYIQKFVPCIYTLRHFYVILQAAGLGCLIGGSILVSVTAAYKSASDKLNL